MSTPADFMVTAPEVTEKSPESKEAIPFELVVASATEVRYVLVSYDHTPAALFFKNAVPEGVANPAMAAKSASYPWTLDPTSVVTTKVLELGIDVPFTEVTFGNDVVADVINDPVVGIVTELIEVMPVGVVLRPTVTPLVPPSHVVPELNARFPPEVSPRELVVEALMVMFVEPLNDTVLMVRAVSNVVAVLALPVSAPVNVAALMVVRPERLVVVAPKLTLVDPIVTVLLESLSTLMFALALISASRMVPLRIIVDVTVPVSACVTAVPVTCEGLNELTHCVL
jgi:hypothetical protein